MLISIRFMNCQDKIHRKKHFFFKAHKRYRTLHCHFIHRNVRASDGNEKNSCDCSHHMSISVYRVSISKGNGVANAMSLPRCVNSTRSMYVEREYSCLVRFMNLSIVFPSMVLWCSAFSAAIFIPFCHDIMHWLCVVIVCFFSLFVSFVILLCGAIAMLNQIL